MGARTARIVVLFSILLLGACSSSTGAPGQSTNATSAPGSPSSGPAGASPMAAESGGPADSQGAPATTAASGGALPTGDPCRFITLAEAKTAVAPDLGKPYALPNSSECDFASQGAGDVSFAFVARDLAFFKTNLPKGADDPVGGHAGWWDGEVGVEGLYLEIPGGLVEIHVRGVFDNTNNGQDKTAAEKLAGFILAKLK